MHSETSSDNSGLDKLMSMPKVAEALGDISKRSVERLIASQELPRPVKVRGRSLLYESDVRNYLEGLRERRDGLNGPETNTR